MRLERPEEEIDEREERDITGPHSVIPSRADELRGDKITS